MHEIRFPLLFQTSNLLKKVLHTKKEEVDDVHIPVERLLKQKKIMRATKSENVF